MILAMTPNDITKLLTLELAKKYRKQKGKIEKKIRGEREKMNVDFKYMNFVIYNAIQLQN